MDSAQMDFAQMIFERTAEIAGRMMARPDGTPTGDYAAKQARIVMAALLGVESIDFQVMKDHRDNLSLELFVK